jgi:hypothetical protein
MTPEHLEEEDLVLHHYGELDAGRTAAAEAHLDRCPDCRRAFSALQVELGAVAADPVPERGEDYGARLWERLRPRLDVAPAGRGVVRRGPWGRRLAYVSALAASLTLAFLLGRHLPRPGETGGPIPAPVRERILLVAVGDHLERSRMVLVELVNAEGPADITAEQHSAEQLVAASRLYRQAVARSGDAGVAAVLEELERVLLEVAHGPSRLSADELDGVRRRIEEGGLLFRVRVLGSQVREREKETGTGEGAGGLV